MLPPLPPAAPAPAPAAPPAAAAGSLSKGIRTEGGHREREGRSKQNRGKIFLHRYNSLNLSHQTKERLIRESASPPQDRTPSMLKYFVKSVFRAFPNSSQFRCMKNTVIEVDGNWHIDCSKKNCCVSKTFMGGQMNSSNTGGLSPTRRTLLKSAGMLVGASALASTMPVMAANMSAESTPAAGPKAVPLRTSGSLPVPEPGDAGRGA